MMTIQSVRTSPKREPRFHAYATLAVIRKGKRVTLGMTLVRKGEKMVELSND